MTYYIATGAGDFTSSNYTAEDVTVLRYVRTGDLAAAQQFAEAYYMHRLNTCLNDWQAVWCAVVETSDPTEALAEIRG